MNQEKVGKLIKEIRIKNNLTQSQFADRYNVSYQAVSKWENGKNLPDITLLTQICKDFNIDINEILNGSTNKIINRKLNNNYIIVGLMVLLLIICLVCFILCRGNNDFVFKTITSNCNHFTISGSIAYNKNKSYLYISNVEYCGGDDNTDYKSIECTLYERKSNDTEISLGKYSYDDNNLIKLEKFLENVEIKLDDFSKQCSKYTKDSLYLEINATDNQNKITTYKIPLSLENNCLSSK